jgi:hypothetical protein
MLVIGGSTLIVAGLVGVEPPTLVKYARTSHPFSEAVSVPVVRLGIVAVGIVIQEEPPSTETCQTTVGVGAALALAENVKVPPA